MTHTTPTAHHVLLTQHRATAMRVVFQRHYGLRNLHRMLNADRDARETEAAVLRDLAAPRTHDDERD